MILDANLVTVLTLIGLTVVVGSLLVALASRARGLLRSIIGTIATVWMIAGVALLIMLGVVSLNASNAFSIDTPHELISAMHSSGAAQVVLDPGQRVHDENWALLHVQRRIDVPYIPLAFTAESSGPTLATTDQNAGIYKLYDPGKRHCDRREYRGQATEICRDFGSALTFRFTNAIPREQR
jgi:hypothetical protein